MLMYDPIETKFYEGKIGRKLTDAEKSGEKPVRIDGRLTYLHLTELQFPYDLMDTVTLFSINKKPRGYTGEE